MTMRQQFELLPHVTISRSTSRYQGDSVASRFKPGDAGFELRPQLLETAATRAYVIKNIKVTKLSTRLHY